MKNTFHKKTKSKKVSFLLPEGESSRSFSVQESRYIPKKIRFDSSQKQIYTRPESKHDPKVDPYFNSLFIRSGFVLPVGMSKENIKANTSVKTLVINTEDKCKCCIM